MLRSVALAVLGEHVSVRELQFFREQHVVAMARMGIPLTGLDHVDLLYPSPRRYRGVYENCRLATIERQVLKIVREDDLPGSEAPTAWLSYLRGGSAHPLRRVLAHNHQDVVSLSRLLRHLVSEPQRGALARD